MRVFTGRFGRRVLVLAAALGVAAGASFATAAITSSSATNTIVACEQNSSGMIKIVSDASQCNPKSETPISWNVVGPAGLQGPKGDTGGIGPAGPQGPPGNSSTVPGPQGLKGDTGAAGAPGGPGIQGPAGTAGTNGIDGTNGTNGKDGKDGVNGLPGKDGTDGLAGKDGVNGTPGADGLSVTNTSLAPAANGTCPEGGSQFTVGGGTATYACNGKDGKDGTAGGTASPRDAYIVQSDNVLGTFAGRSTLTSLTLPAGSWLVTARYDYVPGPGVVVDCYLSGQDPTAADPYASSYVFGRASGGPFQNGGVAIKHAASLEGAITTDAAVTGVSLNCIGTDSQLSTFLQFFNIALAAVAVDNIHAIGHVTP